MESNSILLAAKDNSLVEIPLDVAKQANVISGMIDSADEGSCGREPIDLPKKYDASTLRAVFEWCAANKGEHHCKASCESRSLSWIAREKSRIASTV